MSCVFLPLTCLLSSVLCKCFLDWTKPSQTTGSAPGSASLVVCRDHQCVCVAALTRFGVLALPSNDFLQRRRTSPKSDRDPRCRPAISAKHIHMHTCQCTVQGPWTSGWRSTYVGLDGIAITASMCVFWLIALWCAPLQRSMRPSAHMHTQTHIFHPMPPHAACRYTLHTGCTAWCVLG